MILVIDPDSGIPPYEQLRSQIVAAVVAGDLGPGAQLPTVRRLADDLGIAPNTVARSYRELERDGVIETRGRNGSVIAGPATPGPAADAAQAYARRVGELGLTRDAALELVRAALDGAGPSPSGTSG
ncbi:GntR family transcriptional regulator [Cryobacterium lactosi]|uniref:GntR family transcriptional regulator n=1 Tax=Cryobacterium lactosi TaxID=1259202 RepID=UPI0030B9F92B